MVDGADEHHRAAVLARVADEELTGRVERRRARDGGGGLRVVGPLTAKLGHILPAPGLLVYRAPNLLVTQIDGFSDRQTVAQAAENAVSAG